jgi:hypothetical protein
MTAPCSTWQWHLMGYRLIDGALVFYQETQDFGGFRLPIK